MRNMYTCPGGRLADWPHKAPERTAYRMGAGLNFDAHCVVFTNRAAMLQACRMSETGTPGSRPLRPLIRED
jgi:hypothetical protein